MNVFGNILWIVFGGGLVLALQYILGGVVLCLTLVGIPFGLQCFKLAQLSLLPFGQETYPRSTAADTLTLVMNLVWLLICGIVIAFTHLVFAGLCAVTIIGLPFALQHLKLMKLAIFPFGHELD